MPVCALSVDLVAAIISDETRPEALELFASRLAWDIN